MCQGTEMAKQPHRVHLKLLPLTSTLVIAVKNPLVCHGPDSLLCGGGVQKQSLSRATPHLPLQALAVPALKQHAWLRPILPPPVHTLLPPREAFCGLPQLCFLQPAEPSLLHTCLPATLLCSPSPTQGSLDTGQGSEGH